MSVTRPVTVKVGVIPNYREGEIRLRPEYLEFLRAGGATSVILPLARNAVDAETALEAVDGVLFTGGADIDPVRWGESRHPSANLLAAEREASDFAYLEAALHRNLPILGICLGCQELNVALGGSLYQDLSLVRFAMEEHRDGEHLVEVSDSRLEGWIGSKRFPVRSSHHQVIHRLGDGLCAAACSPDRVVEAVISDRHYFAVGVQWHPERKLDEPSRNLATAFVRAARESALGRRA